MATYNGTLGNNILNGGANNDKLYGDDGIDTLDGGAGNDALNGGHDDDTYLFGVGSGNDTISENVAEWWGNSSSGNDQVVFRDLNKADVTFSKTNGGNNLVVTIKSTGETLTLSNTFSGDLAWNIESYKFNDGVLNLSEINSAWLLTAGTVDNDSIWGWSTNDVLNGRAGDDGLVGLDGNDVLNAGDGFDWLSGGGGSDILNGGANNDILYGDDGIDTLDGGTGNDKLDGGHDDDTYLFAVGSGNDTITENVAEWWGNSSSGNDQVVFTGLNKADVTFSKTNGGNALVVTIKSTGETLTINNTFSSNFIWNVESYKFNDGVLNLSQINSAWLLTAGTVDNNSIWGWRTKDVLNGGAGDDSLAGWDGNDTLNAGAGGDTLNGGKGADILTGGAGNDVFKYNSLAEISYKDKFYDRVYKDSITDLAVGDRIDFSEIAGLVFVGIDNDFSGLANQVRVHHGWNGSGTDTWLGVDTNGDKTEDYSLLLPEHLIIEETTVGSNIYQTVENKLLNGTTADDILIGGNGYDTLTGAAGNDSLVGGAASDVLNGGDGADVLIGGLGKDHLTGGAGNDVFKYNSVTELAGSGFYHEYDTFLYWYNYETITDFAMGDKLDLSAIVGLTFMGNANDFSGVANQVRIYGYGHGYNFLEIDTNGDKEADYRVDIPDYLGIEETTAGSLIFQVAENKLLNGTTADDTLTGSNGYDTLSGEGGNDNLAGESSDDTLTGGDGNDILVGGFGADNLTGGAGKDVFVYNSLAEFGYHYEGDYDIYNDNSFYYGDIITDLTTEDRIDLSAMNGLTFIGTETDFTGIANQIRLSNNSLFIDPQSGQYNVGTALEVDSNGDKIAEYVLRLSFPTVPIVLKETVAGSLIFQVDNKLLNGTIANDILVGGDGYDTLNGDAGNDSLDGRASSDTLNGGDGNDTLVGGLSYDELTGGAGDDVFKYNSLAELKRGAIWNEGEVITDFAVGDKIDLSAIAGLSFVGVGNHFSGVANQVQISTFLATFIEIDTNGDKEVDYDLVISGNSLMIEETAAGSNVFQVIENKMLVGTTGDDTLTSGNGNDTLSGDAGNDSLDGGAYDDTLSGGDGNDILNGGLGNDNLQGGAGNDTYFVNSAGDRVSELRNQGTDTVNSSISYTLTANVEKLVLSGTAAINGTGNTSANRITGNRGNNILDGGAGNDTLTGGTGEDTFRLSDLSNDTIKDFSIADDTIQLKGSMFNVLALGNLSADNFALNTAADADDYLIYNSSTGGLYYDAGGNTVGSAASVQIAVLGVNLALTNADFVVI